MPCQNCLDCLNPCNNCQENISVSPEETCPQLEPCVTGCVDNVMSNCVLLSRDIEMCGATYDENSTLTDLLEDIAEAVDCTNVPCDDVTKTISFTLTDVNKVSGYYDTLDPAYLTKSDRLVSLEINDNSSVTGDVLAYLKYSSLPLSTQYVLTSATLGNTFLLSTNACVNSLIDSTNEIWAEMLTTRSCFETKKCTLDVSRVPWSERWFSSYRCNPQINDLPIMNEPGVSSSVDKGVLFLNDVRPYNSVTSNGGVIRKVNLNTVSTDSLEVNTIAGNITGGTTPVTQNNVWGDVVQYEYNSSICIDKKELTNGEPALYFCTFGGVVCRLVKERNTECDERANWKNYIIAGANTTGNVVGTGNVARFNKPYGLKKWYDINGEPSFLIADNANSTVKLIYYIDGVGGKNSSLNWNVVDLQIALAGVAPNINVEEDPTNGASANTKRIWVLNENAIKIITFTGALTTTGTGDLTDPAEYAGANIKTINTGGGGANTPAATGIGTKVYNPSAITRVDSGGSYFYLYVSENAVVTNCPSDYVTHSKDLIKIEEDPDLTLGTAGDYVFTKLINGATTTSTTPTEIGNFADANCRFVQGFFTDLKGNLYDVVFGGIRKYDLGNNEIDSIVSGANASGETTIDGVVDCFDITDFKSMDTQYEITLNC